MPLFDPASVQAQTLRGDWEIFFGAAVVVAIIMFALILLPLLLWRRRGDALPPQFKKNRSFAYVYILTPFALVAVLFYFTFVKERSVDALVPSPYATVDVTAFRWSWQFVYPHARIRIVGTPQQPPVLVLPLGKITQVNLTSVDVNHAFWIPYFLFKRDAIAGMTNHFDLTPTRLGTFRGLCAEYCGLDHTLMTFQVKVISDADYRRWLATAGKSTP
ncbi:MAG TPA: cytochrome c oxidase subunit II [Candidatus Baltobacteraceae bacterium]